MSPNLENLQPQPQEQAKPPDQPHCWTCNQSFTTQRKLNDHLKFSIRHQPSTSWGPGKNAPPRQSGKAAFSSSGHPNIEDSSPKIALAKDGKPGWSVIPEVDHPAVLEALRIRVHRESTLQTNNYITKPFDPKDYVDRRKCMRCKTKEKDVVSRECRFHPKPLSKPDQSVYPPSFPHL
ncbi:hypothetical protein HYFRA_00006254 [Hymenoscyphus fraxineus]|uniref:Uncharacterized protein n=1 Tax=Hymenoscyphus fraxineus TaxID=746836 RepID=A0A9N9PP86_9HELO|nr:hypothetical protein HYFRA_00006254 [Hymenoscyphus fraxineus]